MTGILLTRTALKENRAGRPKRKEERAPDLCGNSRTMTSFTTQAEEEFHRTILSVKDFGKSRCLTMARSWCA